MDRTTTVEIDGMTCGGCVAHVTQALESVPGVLDVSVELRSGETSPVLVVSNEPLDGDAVRTAIDEAGYAVVGIH